jgi:hypothetical protein
MLSKKPGGSRWQNISIHIHSYTIHTIYTQFYGVQHFVKKLIFAWLFRRFFDCYGTRRFITTSTRPRSYSESDVHPVTICLCVYRRGMDSWMDLLTTYTHHLELQVITPLSIISMLYISPQHLLGLFTACCVFISRSLATASNSRDSSASRVQVLSSQHPVQNLTPNWQLTVSESESDLLYDWRFNANQFVSARSPLRLTTSNFIFQLNICGYSPYATSSLMRAWVCRLQLLVVLASAFIHRSNSWGTHGHILLSQFRDSPNLESQVLVLHPPGTWWPGYTPRHWVHCVKSKSKSHCDWRSVSQ